MIPKEIPVAWIQDKVETWVRVSEVLKSGPMADAAAARAEHYLELLEDWATKHGGRRGTKEPSET